MKLPFGHPSLAPYVGRFQSPSHDAPLTVAFAGTSTLHFSTASASVLLDGFFSRPGMLRVTTGKIAPDRDEVAEGLERLGVERLDAIACVHSHFDHALDAPLIAEITGANLLGSESTANLGRGHGLPESQIRVVDDQPLVYGDLTVTFVDSIHSPGDRIPGTIDEPFSPPASYKRWKTGTCYSIFFEHAAGTVLVQASTNFVAGALDGRTADVVYLGAAMLGKLGEEFFDSYWQEVVLATGARRVIPVHWDNFFKPADPAVALPYLADDFDEMMRLLDDRGRADGVEIVLPPLWEPTDPFA